MKKFLRYLIGLTVTAALVFGFFQFFPDIQPNVGWNSGPSSASLQDDSLAACRACYPPFEMEVGWNS